MPQVLTAKELRLIDKYWRAANYLTVAQIYLFDNPLLKDPLELKHIKPRLLGHWGTTPGLNFIYAHLNRVIKKYDLNMIFLAGPGHGGPGLIANTYLEGTYTELYPEITQDSVGLKKLCKQFSFPGGIPSHVSPDVPGSIHEGGELGYVLAHAYGAVLDNPGLIAACVIGDGEAETGALATSWHSNKFLNPINDGAVLPILHLNGYKISNPTILARIDSNELTKLLEGYGYKPYFVEYVDIDTTHQQMAEVLDKIILEIKSIKNEPEKKHTSDRPRWPLLVLRTPKGWTCPKEIDGLKVEDYWRSHQVPIDQLDKNPSHVRELEKWLKSYHPEELFDNNGALLAELRDLAPPGQKRMSVNPHTNGGLLLKDLIMPDFRNYALKVPKPGGLIGEATKVLAQFLRDIFQLNAKQRNFRIVCPDEISSNRLDAVLETTNRTWVNALKADDAHLAADGRVMEVLSEHLCQGWLEGYLLTGRHGLFACYEAFIHVIDSMLNQHAKWLKVTHSEIPWRRPIASLNYLLTSHVWRQDHNGFSHQDPGFIDHVVNKKAAIVRVYFPCDANTLLVVTDKCLRSRNCINVIVAGKQPSPQWLNMDDAYKHCVKGIGIFEWASNDKNSDPDLVLASAGDIPTIEMLAAVEILRKIDKNLKIRVINVIDLMALQPPETHPHGLADDDFDNLFTTNKPIIFAYHGYPGLIHRLAYRRANHHNLHVHGFREEGTTTTPFDMVVRNNLDRYHLVENALKHVPKLEPVAAYTREMIRDKLIEHKNYIDKHGIDLPEIRNWSWRGC